jgi:ATP-dependent helicase/nuclease subunit B
MHRGWLKKWQQIIPSYIDLQISVENESWTVNSVESEGSHKLESRRTIKGRVDRTDIDKENSISIIDYKTGSTPGQRDIEDGEAIQLPVYALLMENVKRVLYLKLDGDAKIGATLEGDHLNDLKTNIIERLVTIIGNLESGKPLPAWGDSTVCRYCDMDGLCRKQSWVTEPAE